MSRFQFPTHACPSHSSLPAHPARISDASTTAINLLRRTHVSSHHPEASWASFAGVEAASETARRLNRRAAAAARRLRPG